jgi:caffeoyl-CoA O-methyltransferase
VIDAFEPFEAYAERVSTPLAPHLADVAARTRTTQRDHGMLTGHLEGGLLAFLVALARPRLVVEVGTFTGFSALAMATALPEDGRIVTCEIDPERAAVARDHIELAGESARVEVRLGPALDTLATVDGPVDLAFVDADKESYIAYYETLVPKLAPAGAIVADNVLWGGRVLDETDTSSSTAAIRAFNDHVAADPRTVNVVLTVRDGVQLIRLA